MHGGGDLYMFVLFRLLTVSFSFCVSNNYCFPHQNFILNIYCIVILTLSCTGYFLLCQFEPFLNIVFNVISCQLKCYRCTKVAGNISVNNLAVICLKYVIIQSCFVCAICKFVFLICKSIAYLFTLHCEFATRQYQRAVMSWGQCKYMYIY